QRMGAFKFRGAYNALSRLSQAEKARGVVTHSSGNHAQGIALAAKLLGISAVIVMPTDAPASKLAATRGYGAEIVPYDRLTQDRAEISAQVARERGLAFVHPYDNPHVMAGQGTAALELFEEIPALDAIVAPVGGGGLVSGTALCASELSPSTSIFAAEPAGADDAARSKASGVLVTEQTPRTIADGLRTTLGLLTWPVIRDRVADVIVVDDGAIVRAMRLLFERAKLVVEPSGAVPLAAVLDERFRARGLSRVGVILSGGNVDLDALPW
ncbi:partial threonine dehydratase, partial [Anaerolineae bacterium]